jgi:tetratricopeptide (TPR) repeat protein
MTLNVWAGSSPARAARLLAIAKLADPDPWRDRLRDLLAENDRDAIHRLAQEPSAELSPENAILLGIALVNIDMRTAAKFLRRAARRYPGDLWLNYAAGRAIAFSVHGPAPDAIPYLRAALALAPGSREVYHILGQALSRIDALEALGVWEQAARRWPDDQHLVIHLGSAQIDAGRHDEGLASLRGALQKRPDDWYGHEVLAREFKRRNEIEEARREALKALELAPTTTVGLTALLQDVGCHREALAAARAHVEAHPLEGDAHGVLADLLLESGDVQAAIAEAEIAVRLVPESAIAHSTLAHALVAAGRRDEGVAVQRRALALGPADEQQLVRLTNMLMETGDFDGALEVARETIRHHPDKANGYNALGNALGAKGKLDEALAAFREGLQREPDSALVHYNMARCLALRGDLRGAEAGYRRAVEADPNHVAARNNLSMLLAGTGRLEEAIEVLEEAAAIAGDTNEFSYMIHANLGFTHRRMGRTERAIAAFRKVVEIVPGKPEAYEWLGFTFCQAGRHAEMVELFRGALERFPDRATLFNEYAWCLIVFPDPSRRDHGEAARLARRAVELEPSHGNSWGTLAAALCGTGEFEEALRAVTRSIEIDGIDQYDLTYLALAQHGLGRVEEARQTFARIDAAALDPDARKCYEEAREAMR